MSCDVNNNFLNYNLLCFFLPESFAATTGCCSAPDPRTEREREGEIEGEGGRDEGEGGDGQGREEREFIRNFGTTR
jgi:hypothetical protein